jgi:hypothetical protein
MRAKTIEQALAWAYVEQKVHLAREQWRPKDLGRSVKPRLAAMDFGATPVDQSMHFDFEAHPDAYVIHDTVMSLQPFRYIRSADEIEMLVARRLMGDQVTAAGNLADLSYHAYDEHGEMVVERVAVSRAQQVRRQISVLPGPIIYPASLIFQAATTGKRPDPIADPMYIAERGPSIYKDQHRNLAGRMIRWVGDEALKVVEARRIYASWWQSLSWVRDGVKGGLTSFEIEDGMPPAPLPIDPS